MRIEAVVVNASPLISLFRSGQSDLLPRLFNRIVVPEAVFKEVALDERHDPAARELGTQMWPIRESVTPSPRVEAWNLGAGETAVLSFALAAPPVRAIIDDAAARRCARTHRTTVVSFPSEASPMTESVIIPAHIENGTLCLDAPLPADLDRVEVRGYRAPRRDNSALGEIVALIESLPPGTRTKEDIDRQVAEERSSWR